MPVAQSRPGGPVEALTLQLQPTPATPRRIGRARVSRARLAATPIKAVGAQVSLSLARRLSVRTHARTHARTHVH